MCLVLAGLGACSTDEKSGRSSALKADCGASSAPCLNDVGPSASACGDAEDCGAQGCTDRPCAAGTSCIADADCSSGRCLDERCTTASCEDGIQNGAEEDIDCGGQCAACEVDDCAGTDCMPSGGAPYPEGPYGDAVGDVVDNLFFMTDKGDETSFGSIRQSAQSGLLVIFSTAAWCGRCAGDMPDLIALHEAYNASGLQMRVSLFESAEYDQPAARDAQIYQRGNQLPFDVLVDANAQLHRFFDDFSLPMVMVVELSTMRLLYAKIGWQRAEVDGLVSSHLNDE